MLDFRLTCHALVRWNTHSYLAPERRGGQGEDGQEDRQRAGKRASVSRGVEYHAAILNQLSIQMQGVVREEDGNGYGIIKDHHGTIKVESSGGKGTCFVVCQPLTEEF